jgi:mannose-1-phosphate guanylyltransferase / mannose-6-phosphate isomerase
MAGAAQSKIIPVVLSGGAGTRLWPLSRERLPKQFLSIVTDHTMLQDTIMRCQGDGFSDEPVIVSLADQAALISDQLGAIGITADILLEPARRDSCAAVISGAIAALARDENALVLLLAADHHISDVEGFRAKVLEARDAARMGYVVTFGITPTRPAMSYGYLAPGIKIDGTSCFKLSRFREKPALEVARQYIAEGCLWNSGNFLARAQDLVDAAKQVAPEVLAAAVEANQLAKRTGRILTLDQKAYEKSPRISLDYAIMEKISNAAVIPVSYGWSDVGTWDSIAEILPHDTKYNTVSGPASVVNGSNNLVYASGVPTIVNGLDDVIVVTTPDGVLVTRRGRSEELKTVLADLAKAGKAVPS